MWYQYVIQGLAPLADLFFIIGLLIGDTSTVLGFYLSFFIVDYFVALYTFKLERVTKTIIITVYPTICLPPVFHIYDLEVHYLCLKRSTSWME